MSEEPMPFVDRRADSAERYSKLEARLDEGSVRMDRIETEVKALREELKTNTSVTTEVRDILDAAKGFFKVAGELGKVVKWVGGIASAVGAVWWAITQYKAGHVPPIDLPK